MGSGQPGFERKFGLDEREDGLGPGCGDPHRGKPANKWFLKLAVVVRAPSEELKCRQCLS